MPITNSIIVICWVVFIGYWAVSAFNVKKDIGTAGRWFNFFLIRALLIAVAIWLISLAGTDATGSFKLALQQVTAFAGAGTGGMGGAAGVAASIIGAALCVAGIAFAVWARYHLGRNWSGVPSIKEGHELVTSGPYRFVRHPIYTGILAAVFGSALVAGWIWLVVFVILTIMFVLRIKKKEGFMMKLFPDQYPAYRARTKALVPWVW